MTMCPYCGAAKGEYCGMSTAKVFTGKPCPFAKQPKPELN